MIKIVCDICGKEIKEDEHWKLQLFNRGFLITHSDVIPVTETCCPRCAKKIRKMISMIKRRA